MNASFSTHASLLSNLWKIALDSALLVPPCSTKAVNGLPSYFEAAVTTSILRSCWFAALAFLCGCCLLLLLARYCRLAADCSCWLQQAPAATNGGSTHPHQLIPHFFAKCSRLQRLGAMRDEVILPTQPPIHAVAAAANKNKICNQQVPCL